MALNISSASAFLLSLHELPVLEPRMINMCFAISDNVANLFKSAILYVLSWSLLDHGCCEQPCMVTSSLPVLCRVEATHLS